MLKQLLFLFPFLLAGCNPPPCTAPAYNAERYLVVDTTGGLGNRFNAIASGAAVAKLTGRKLVVWWDHIPDELPASFHDLFTNDYLQLEDAPLPAGWTPMDLLDKCVRCDSVVKRWSVSNDDYKDLPTLLHSDAQYIVVRHVVPFGTAEQPKESLTETIRFMEELSPVDDVKKAVSDFKQKHFAGKHMVGVHYRALVLSADVKLMARPKFELYVNKMKQAIEEDASIAFFVASDSPKIVDRFEQEFPGRVVRYPSFGIARENIEDMKIALIEWLLLGESNYIIGSNTSTFSISAALRTKERRNIAIGPGDSKAKGGQLFCFEQDGGMDEGMLNFTDNCPAHHQ